MKAKDVLVREALERDVPGIRAIFEEVYAGDYPYDHFFDEDWLKRAVFNDSLLVLVAEDTRTGELLGTASVVFDVSTFSDLTGEFGRLAVPSVARGRGIGNLLMEQRIAFVQERLHAAVVDNRTVHPFSQKISERFGLSCVGFLPSKLLFRERESIAHYAMIFEAGRALRCNHPRVVPEAQALAHLALRRTGFPVDMIVDESSPSYPREEGLVLEELTADGAPALLRIERGRVHRREIFGPIRLHYGYFLLETRKATYLIAREQTGDDTPGPIVGAIGYIHYREEHTVKVFELIARTDGVIRFLWQALLKRAQTQQVAYLEVDVSAHAPRMQRTLLELGFLPVAYIPAAVFADVERLDVLKMVRLFVPPPSLDDVSLTPAAREVARLVMRGFAQRAARPQVASVVEHLALFEGLNREQRHRLAAAFEVAEHHADETLYTQGEPADALYLLLSGKVSIEVDHPPRCVGILYAGDCIGELSLLTKEPHSATARIQEDLVAATLSLQQLSLLSRQRPDITMTLYRNLAIDIGRKLQKIDASLIEFEPKSGSFIAYKEP